MARPHREFLQLALLASVSRPLPGRAWAAEAGLAAGGSAPKKVLIIGAGLSGLVAAHELNKAGLAR